MIHNPENVESPGPGYRFLTVEERSRRAGKYAGSSPNIEAFIGREWSRGWVGSSPAFTYRTKLTPEELEAEG